MRTTVLLTRPRHAAEAFAERLRAAGLSAPILIAPVIEIRPLAPLPDPASYPLLVFTSANAVSALGRRPDLARRPAWCVGDATAEAAHRAGLDGRSAGGDAGALLDLLFRERPQGPALHLRGRHGVGELAARLTAGGLPTDEAVVYEQEARPLSPEAQALLAADCPVVLPLFSPRSARLVAAAGPITAPRAIVAISEQVAASWTGGGSVLVAAAPDATAMTAAVASAVRGVARE